MKKHYVQPSLELISLGLGDVLLASTYKPTEWEMPILRINQANELEGDNLGVYDPE